MNYLSWEEWEQKRPGEQFKSWNYSFYQLGSFLMKLVIRIYVAIHKTF